MSVAIVKEYLKSFGLDTRVKEFEESSATVELAAKAANVIPARIAKSISFLVNEIPILIVTSGDTKIDNKKFKEKFFVKAKMMTPDEVFKFTGHAIGGVCPFAIEDNSVNVYLDESMKRFETVLPAAGSSNSCIELTMQELEIASDYREWIDVCKTMEIKE